MEATFISFFVKTAGGNRDGVLLDWMSVVVKLSFVIEITFLSLQGIANDRIGGAFVFLCGKYQSSIIVYDQDQDI